jgi:hypothetical protein
MRKIDIMNKAQDLCDSSFTKKEPGSWYDAWSTMSTLITKFLVIKKGSPARCEKIVSVAAHRRFLIYDDFS